MQNGFRLVIEGVTGGDDMAAVAARQPTEEIIALHTGNRFQVLTFFSGPLSHKDLSAMKRQPKLGRHAPHKTFVFIRGLPSQTMVHMGDPDRYGEILSKRDKH